jgi:hypothetical protein
MQRVDSSLLRQTITARGKLNVGKTERIVSAAAGAALAAYGLGRGGQRPAATVLAGGILLYRGLSGHCPVYGGLGRTKSMAAGAIAARNPRDAIVKHHEHRHLRLRPAPLRRLHPDHEEGRHPRPRVHGRGGGGGQRGEEPEAVGRPRGGAPSPSPAAVLLLPAAALVPVRQLQPQRRMAEKAVRLHRGAGLFGYSHMIGGYAGGQAEYVRVPFADVGPMKVPNGPQRRAGALPLRHLPHRLHGGRELRHRARRHRGGVGLRPGRAVRHPSAWMLGAERVIAIDRVPSGCAWPPRRPAPRPSTSRR